MNAAERFDADKLPAGSWPCACLKRDRRTGRQTHIRINDATLERCRNCGATRDEAYALMQSEAPPDVE